MPDIRVLLIFAVAVAAALAPACRRGAEQTDDSEAPIPVIAERVRLGDIRGTVSATGVVASAPGASVAIAATHPARIAEITKNAGDPVKAGDILVRFDYPALGAQLLVNQTLVKAAEARRQQAKLAQSRISALVERGAASRSELDAAEQEAAAAEGELIAARAALQASESQGRQATITAPFDGTVIERLHEPGDTVRPDESDPILKLIDPRQVHVSAQVAAPDAARFTVGASARAVAQGQTTSEVLRVATRPIPEAAAKTVEVTLSFETPTALAPGTQVALEIDAEQRSNVPLVPAIAVLRTDPSGPAVIVASGGVAERRQVAIGLVDAENIEILSGLKSGELIITQGHSSLRDGTPISVSAP